MDGNLIRFNTEDSQFRIFAPEDNQSYTSFCITRENSIWIGSSDGLISLLNPEDETMESYNVFAHSSPNTPQKLSMLYPSPTTDRIYIAFEHDDVKIFDPATRRVLVRKSAPTKNSGISVLSQYLLPGKVKK